MSNSNPKDRPNDLVDGTKSITQYRSSAYKALAAAVNKHSAIDKTLQKALANLNQTSAFDKLSKSLTAHQSAFDKAFAAANRASAFKNTMLSIERWQSTIEKAKASLPKPMAFENLMGTLSNHQSILDKAIAAAMTKTTVIEESLRSIAQHHSAFDKAMSTMANPRNIASSLSVLKSSSHFFIKDTALFSAMLESVATVSPNLETEISISEVERLNQELANSEDIRSYKKNFLNLPQWLRLHFVTLLLHVFLPIMIGVSANLLTPLVSSYLENSTLSKREKINKIKKAPQSLEFVYTEELRFISGTNVRLRQGPSTNSAILDEMDLGQIVTVLSQKRNWIQVTYEYKNGEVFKGWVFTRYAKKFKK